MSGLRVHLHNATFIRRCIHTFVVVAIPITMTWFLIRCLQALMTVPNITEMPFIQHGIENLHLFFSFWVSGLQYLYFSAYSVIDVLEILSVKWNRKDFHRYIDWIHSTASYLLFTLVFPLSVMVFVLFWSMYYWDRTYIYPYLLDEWVSPIPNHVMHTFPVPLSILYMLISNKKEPSQLLTLSGLVAFLAFYSYLFFDFKMTKGKWIYLCLENLTPSQVQWVLAFAGFSPILFHFLGYKMNKFFKSLRQDVPFLRLLTC
ncbi:hypothetical protein GE061_016323 [Apolygus lucorum]|uniref:Androgen-dependent TFPI-regulating protein n=1 Tax=Apolygus lucorum TaxID=248454 RepID=A0A6A4K175_APOLU|nr:hypothetical protein GE061_016323 [Apolygus lucorum]